MAKPTSVEVLVRRAQRGDRAAFDELAARHRDRLLDSIRGRLRRREVSAIDPEDVLNETLLRAFQSLNRFEWTDEDSFLKWLFGICRNVQLEASRRAHGLLSLGAADRMESRAPTPSQSIRREERFARLKKAIDALPPHYRDVVYLSRIDGLKVKDVAQRLGKSADSVKHLLARALRLLRENFGDTRSLNLPDQGLRDAEERHER